MRRTQKSIAGVTLLEIMLVLAVAALIIVMSIRYYQSATASQQANTAMNQIQAITAAADNLSVGTGSYTDTVSESSVKSLMPNNSMTTPWNTDITVAADSATSYTVTFSTVPTAVCPLLTAKLKGQAHFSDISTCTSTAADVSYTYNSAT